MSEAAILALIGEIFKLLPSVIAALESVHASVSAKSQAPTTPVAKPAE